MKLFILCFLTFSLSLPALAEIKLCEVYGITDSPQKLDCTLSGEEFKLRCKNGVYFLNETQVDVAYHEEVEDGPVPLIFRTKDAKLSVMMYSPRKIEADFSRRSQVFSGSCRP